MQGATLFKAEGHTLPRDVLERMIGKYPDCTGIITVSDDKKNLVCLRTKKAFKVNDLVAKLDMLKDRMVLISMYKLGAGETVEVGEEPPYTVISTSDNKPALVVALNADMSQFYEKNSSFPPEHFAIRDHIIPKIKKLYGFLNGDLDKLFDEFEDPQYVTDFNNLMMGEHGSILFFGFNGIAKQFGRDTDKISGIQDWGWMSDTRLLSDQPAEEPAPAEQPAGDSAESLFAEMAGNEEEKPSEENAPQPAVAPVVPAGAPVVAPNPSSAPAARRGLSLPGASAPVEAKPSVASTTSVATPAASNSGNGASVPSTVSGKATSKLGPNDWMKIKIPDMSIDKRANWIRKRMPGRQLPEGWEKATHISLKVVDAAKAPKAFLQTYLEQNKLAGAEALTALGITIPRSDYEEPKLEESKAPNKGKPRLSLPGTSSTAAAASGTNGSGAAVAKSEERPGETKPVTGALPIIGAKEKESVIAYFRSSKATQMIDKHSNFISDPKNWGKMEVEVAAFEKQLPIFKSCEDMFKWSYPLIHELPEKTAKVSLYNMILYAMELHRMLEGVTTPETKPNEAPAQQPSVQPSPSPEPVPQEPAKPAAVKRGLRLPSAA